MAISVVEPKGKGALLLDSHPGGCERSVEAAAASVGPTAPAAGPAPTALVIGSSAGYGNAITTAGLVGLRMSGIGLCLERGATARRSASAGWYRTRALASLAERHGADFEFHNGDCYADDTKRAILARLAERFGRIDHLVYSVAAPRRTDRDGIVHQSSIKPLGAPHATWSLDLDGGARTLRRAEIEPATPDEVAATVKVMGGEDWAAWVEALAEQDLLAPGFTTVALTYIGSALTAPIYRHGTIGQAKNDLEATTRKLEETLKPYDGKAITSVNGAAVTNASTAIPGISLYSCLLHGVLGEAMQSPTTQGMRLWRHLVGSQALEVDPEGRVRLDDWEFADGVQKEVEQRWHAAIEAGEVSAAEGRWFLDEVHRLYGFAVPGVDYTQPQELDLPWPSPR
jgi:enoyl-[acyl-carrier protein] reductase/trans-2-enoyl-CoA reductase (NAD+)